MILFKDISCCLLNVSFVMLVFLHLFSKDLCDWFVVFPYIIHITHIIGVFLLA